jgi:antitoxin component HigA of HigAB toxin-antitoxin module
MSTATKKARKDSYLALIMEHPLKTIRRDSDYDAAVRVLNKLVVRDDLDDGEEQYLDVLEALITLYDEKHHLMPPDDSTPLERLKGIMESSGTSAAQLRDILGISQPMVSMILTGQRELSKKAIAKLADRFKVEHGYFW